jgi:hypothetical protein
MIKVLSFFRLLFSHTIQKAASRSQYRKASSSQYRKALSSNCKSIRPQSIGGQKGSVQQTAAGQRQDIQFPQPVERRARPSADTHPSHPQLPFVYHVPAQITLQISDLRFQIFPTLSSARCWNALSTSGFRISTRTRPRPPPLETRAAACTAARWAPAPGPRAPAQPRRWWAPGPAAQAPVWWPMKRSWRAGRDLRGRVVFLRRRGFEVVMGCCCVGLVDDAWDKVDRDVQRQGIETQVSIKHT